MRCGYIRLLVALAAAVLLPGCDLDRERALRAELSQYLYLGDTLHLASKPTCTVGVFSVDLGTFRGGLAQAVTMHQAVQLIGDQRPVVFADRNMSPNAITEALLEADLHSGLGLLSSGLAPIAQCMEDDAIASGFYNVMIADAAQLMYDPKGDALVLLYPPERLALFLRRSDW